jgi:Mn2+/Fe2+ NRAMP family transporter
MLGVSVFFISAAFQFGNNLGVLSAIREFETPIQSVLPIELDYLVVLLNLLAVLFLFLFHNLYRFVERLMMLFVGLMLICFAVNLVVAKPNVPQLVIGLIPPVWAIPRLGWQDLDVSLLGLVGTTFVVTAAYYQSFLVRQRGWTVAELPDGMLDVRVSVAIMATLTLMLISTAAAVLQGMPLESLSDVANGLRPTFGATGHALFCLGLFCAAYSSFLVNSMIGGFILADGLGWGNQPADLVPRIMTVIVLLTGMTVALLVSRAGFDPVPAIVAAQATTVVAAPLVAGVLWWLANRRSVMGERRIGWKLNWGAGFGFLMLLAMAWNTAAYRVIPQVREWLANGA